MNAQDLLDLDITEWPDNARAIVEKAVQDERADLDERLAAAELAGDAALIDDDLAELLLSLVNRADAPEELRAAAAVALGPALEMGDLDMSDDGFYDPRDVPISEEMFEGIRDRLQKLYTDASLPKLVRRRILEAAVRSPQDWQQGAIRAAAASNDPEWKLTAVFGMGYVPGFEPQIIETLGATDPELRLQAVLAAGRREIPGAVPRILPLLRVETEKQLLLAAIEAASGMPWDKVGDALDRLKVSQDEEIAAAAEEAGLISRGLAGLEGLDEGLEEDE